MRTGLRIFGAATALMDEMGGTFLPPLAPFASANERAAAALDEEHVAAALAEGSELDLIDAVALARQAAALSL